MNLVKFPSDTKHRKQWFTGLHFSHPAKLHLSLQLWLIDNFTKEGETILDPMAGSGTLMVCCSLGRNCILLDLEQKFVDMMKGNWKKVQQRGAQMGYQMGQAIIMQGDARNLEGLLVDKIVTSPTYGNPRNTSEEYDDKYDLRRPKGIAWGRESFRGRYGETAGQIGILPYGAIDKIITSPPYGELANEKKNTKSNVSREERLRRAGYNPNEFMGGTARNASIEDGLRYSHDNKNIGNLPYGNIDKIITSPPYEEAMGKKHHSPRADKLAEEKHNPVTYTDKVDHIITSPPYENAIAEGDAGPLARASHDPSFKDKRQCYTKKVDAVISSPPYEASVTGGGSGIDLSKTKRDGDIRHQSLGLLTYGTEYSKDKNNIGNLKSDSYLSAMLQVYQQCYVMLKDGGLLILVTKNFIHNKKHVKLDLDTIKLCEQAGFTFQDRWYRELASQSFWRTIYHQRYPSVPPIKYEDILIFQKRE